MFRVLIVDDDAVQLRLTSEVAARAGFQPITATSGQQALDLLRADLRIGAVVLDLVMPDLDGMAVLEQMRHGRIATPVIVQTADPSLETVVTAMRQGAVDFFVKPVAPERMIVSLRNAVKLGELESLVRSDRARLAHTMGLADIVARSPAMDRVLSLCAKAARTTLPVLIEGEAGTGKDLLARVIHGTGERAGRPFVTVNCANTPPSRIDAVLFGSRRGVIAGDNADSAGKLAEAHGGTILLDEIGELPLDTQSRLLKALERGETEPLGGDRPVRVNVRLLASTSRRLLNLARSGDFREDLYYRLNVFPIYLPPLRDRPEDLPALATVFATRHAAETGKRIAGLSEAALGLLKAFAWPGNVGQLENSVYRAVALAATTVLEPVDFPQIVAQGTGRAEALRHAATFTSSAPVHIDDARVHKREAVRTLPATDRFVADTGEVAALADVERELIVFALVRYGYRMSRVARALGIGRSTLYRKLREYGLDEGVASHAA